MNFTDALCEVLACPESAQTLVLQDNTLVSEDGQYQYPLINGVPWLLPHPENSLMDWSVKLNHFNQVLLAEVNDLQNELEAVEPVVQDRFRRLILGKEKFIKCVSELMLPLVVTQAANKTVYDALRDRAPSTQNLLSYEANLYRDWVWGEEENKISADLVASALAPVDVGKMIVLGAGAGRLALDLHASLSPTMTVATDINPLLVFAANHLLSGKQLALPEFPQHPRKSEFVALEHIIDGAKSRPENFHLLFGDANRPAFKKGAFDTVVTPWLIDIQPYILPKFLRQLNQHLKCGGSWVNFGSLVFNQRRDAHCYTIEEVQAVARQHGFEISAIEEHEIPYLKSPYNAGHRNEHIWLWRATKVEDVMPLEKPQALPSWLLDETKNVPAAGYMKSFLMTHHLYAELVSQVDGKTSLAAISQKMAKKHGVDNAESLHMVRKFFTDLHLQNG